MSYYTASNYNSDTQTPSQMSLNAQQQTSLTSLLASAAVQQAQHNPAGQNPQAASLLGNQNMHSPSQIYNHMANNVAASGASAGNYTALSTSNSSTGSSTYQSLLLSSPQTSVASLYSTQRARFMSSKGFDVEDDMEFCPEIVHTGKSKFNPYTSQTFSPNTSPEAAAPAQTSPLSPGTQGVQSLYSRSAQATPGTPSGSSPRPSTPRTKKVLEIVNPHTGMKISQGNVSAVK